MTPHKGVRYKPGGRTEASAPTEAQQEVQWAGDRKGRPYESVTRGAVRWRAGASGPADNMRICTSPGRVVQEADPYAPFADRMP